MASISRWGQDFELAEKVGLLPLIKFARIAKAGVDADDMEGLVAQGELLEQCFTDEAWTRFETVATTNRADGEELMTVVSEAIELISQRPTQESSDSSDGPTTTQPSSVGDSSSRVLSRLDGRPDLQLAVVRAQEAQAAQTA